jgi:hypothetical protein
MNLFAQVEHLNLDDRYVFGDPNVHETFTSNRGELYQLCREHYGRCVGKVRLDGKEIGWYFLKRQKYDDCDDTFLCETWVTVHSAPPVTETHFNYA